MPLTIEVKVVDANGFNGGHYLARSIRRQLEELIEKTHPELIRAAMNEIAATAARKQEEFVAGINATRALSGLPPLVQGDGKDVPASSPEQIEKDNALLAPQVAGSPPYARARPRAGRQETKREPV